MADEPPAGAPPVAARAVTPASEKRAKWWNETKTDLKWATALLFVLILAISGFLWAGWKGETAGEEDLAEVTQLIFSTNGLVVPFEVLSILLLAALVAGVVIAFRDPEGAD